MYVCNLQPIRLLNACNKKRNKGIQMRTTRNKL
uniref:Uncharacterized protein n=1 Tax=Rhizophora mucronata TaxID=61149 RepID=A0A2P2N2Q6_RHIMU